MPELVLQLAKLPQPCLWIFSLPGQEIPMLTRLLGSQFPSHWIFWKGDGLIKNAHAIKLTDLESLLNTAGFRPFAHASNHSEAKPQILFHRDPRMLPLLERISSLEPLLKEKEEWLKHAETLKAKVSTLEPLLKEKEEWHKHEETLKAKVSTLEPLLKEKEEWHKHEIDLKNAIEEQSVKQRLVDEEMAKVDAQLEFLRFLIKQDTSKDEEFL